jgi:signal transduction histidine kinase
VKDNIKNVRFYIIADLIIFVICLFGINNYWQKADLPFKIYYDQNHLIIKSIPKNNNDLSNGDILISINKINLHSREEVEVYLDGKLIDEKVQIETINNGNQKFTQVTLINFYSKLYDIIALIVGFVFFLAGIFVLVKGNDKHVGIVFHWCMVTTSMIILMTWGNFTNLNLFTGILTRVGFHFGYAFVPSVFLHFSLLFPFESRPYYKNLLKYVYGLSLLFSISLSIIFTIYAIYLSPKWIEIYLKSFDVCSIFVVITIIYAIFIQYKNYNSTELLSDRKKLRWILLGYFIGPISYLFLWVIPQRISTNGLIPEEYVLILIAAVPITFAIAIMKYQIMDTEIIVRRTIVYPISILFLILVYIGIISMLLNFIDIPSTNITSITAAIFIALMFHPVKETVKRIVNKKIFKVEYDYRTALNTFLYEIKETDNIELLTKKILNLLNNLMPVEKAGYYSLNKFQNELQILANYNIDQSFTKISFDFNSLQQNEVVSFAMPKSVEPGTNIEFCELPIFTLFDTKLLYLIKSGTNNILGVLVLGEKKSKARFSVEDIDLLNIITTKLGETIERIILQEELFMEKIEKEKLEKLNELKSYFVSSVSHDLKTPLTSIKMFTEILKSSQKVSDEKKAQYLDIIEGESNRLSRLIDNVLNYSKIEKGIKEYHFGKVEVNKLINDVINSMEYLFMMQKFTYEKHLFNRELFINADRDSIIEAIINLISNSIKFSIDKKILTISAYKEYSFVVISIKDEGIGISDQDCENLFKPFFQSNKLNANQSTGAGLGLSIVKNIMDAHKGKIEFDSSLGKGTTFRLIFPIMEEINESNIIN